MKKAILGKKLGMTQLFLADGRAVPVTVVEAGPCVVVQKKTVDSDGYSSVQVAFGPIKEKAVKKPLKGHFAKAHVKPARFLREFKLTELGALQVGSEILVDVFAAGEKIDVTGVSKGKGFAGVIKRHGFRIGPMGHGSKSHREPGSMQSRDASHVFKGKKLPGHMGSVRRTVQGLEIVKVDVARNLLVIKGSVPGAKGALLTIKDSVKA